MSVIIPLDRFKLKHRLNLVFKADDSGDISVEILMPKIFGKPKRKRLREMVLDELVKNEQVYDVPDIYALFSEKKVFTEFGYFDIELGNRGESSNCRLKISASILELPEAFTCLSGLYKFAKRHLAYSFGDLTFPPCRKTQLRFDLKTSQNQGIGFLSEPLYTGGNALSGIYVQLNDKYILLITTELEVPKAVLAKLLEASLVVSRPIFKSITIAGDGVYSVQPEERNESEKLCEDIDWGVLELTDRYDKEIELLRSGLISSEECHYNITDKDIEDYVSPGLRLGTASSKNFLDPKPLCGLKEMENFEGKISIPGPARQDDKVTLSMLDEIEVASNELKQRLLRC